jgi:RimJ/RimL family protein N-acetyltransferase
MLEYKKISEVDSGKLLKFFSEIVENEDDLFFHPHAFDEETVKYLCVNYKGKDLYYVIYLNFNIVGYAMLRGWDEGYEIPSLGIILSKNIRGSGISKNFMEFLHLIAKNKESKRIRITVNNKNIACINLAKKLGYSFKELNESTLLGFFDFKNQ